MRFRAPARADVQPDAFAHPAFAPFAHRTSLFQGPGWPDVAELNRQLSAPAHRVSGVALQFIAQTPAVLRDGLHYEARIFHTGLIATRASNWHDLFNAMMWMDRFAIKCAINAAYVRELPAPAGGPRTRAQSALTHFDEAGAIVVLSDSGLLEAWDQHDWHGLFWRQRERWEAGASLLLFGHALLEHLLAANPMPVAKCLIVDAPSGRREAACIRVIAREIAAGRLLRDPKELRPLPLAGLTGWHAENRRELFYRESACFQPLRTGRVYPEISLIDAKEPEDE